MARKTIAERIAQLDAQKKALQARAGKQQRANDTRRKVLLGALILQRIENDHKSGGMLRDFLEHELPGFLTRDADKVLFEDLLGAVKSSASATPTPVSEPPKNAVETLMRRVEEDI